MKEIIKKPLIIFQIFLLLAPCFADMCGPQYSDAIPGRVAAVSSALNSYCTVVNANLEKQLKLLIALSDFASNLVSKKLPADDKTSSLPIKHRECNARIAVINDFSSLENEQASGFKGNSQFQFSFDRVAAQVHLWLLCVFLLFFNITRSRSASYFFLLPRAGIDDYVLNIGYSYSPLTVSQWGFLFGGNHV